MTAIESHLYANVFSLACIIPLRMIIGIQDSCHFQSCFNCFITWRYFDSFDAFHIVLSTSVAVENSKSVTGRIFITSVMMVSMKKEMNHSVCVRLSQLQQFFLGFSFATVLAFFVVINSGYLHTERSRPTSSSQKDREFCCGPHCRDLDPPSERHYNEKYFNWQVSHHNSSVRLSLFIPEMPLSFP